MNSPIKTLESQDFFPSNNQIHSAGPPDIFLFPKINIKKDWNEEIFLDLQIPKNEVEINFPKIPSFAINQRQPSTQVINSDGFEKSAKSSMLRRRAKNTDYEECEVLETKEQEIVKLPKSKLYQLISHFYLIKKFISNIRNSTIYRKPKWLNNFHFRVINDWSFFNEGVGFFQGKKKSRNMIIFETFIMYFYKKIVNLKGKVPVFHPTQTFHVIFDCVILLLTFTYMIIIPINIGFDIDFLTSLLPNNVIWIKNLSLCLFFLDILMALNTAYFDKGQVIITRKKIIWHYLKGDFPLDLLSLSSLLVLFYFDPLTNSSMSLSSKILGLFYLIRITNLYKILNRIEEFLFLDEKRYNILAFFKLLFSVLLFSHCCACLWHYIGYNYEAEEITWINVLRIHNSPWMIRYLNSIYFIAVVMNTLGFGDITPTNNVEKLFCIFLIYITCTMFAYIINSIGVILNNLNKDSREFKRYMNVINGYLRQNKINFGLRIKIRNYLEYIWQEEKISNVEEAQEIINKRLSKSLKDELILNSNGVFLKNIPLLTENFSEETLNRLSYEMKECNMTPGDIIYNHHDLDDCLYIIRKGKVELFIETQKRNDNITIIKTLKKGDVIGEIGFFREMAKDSSARSVTFTSLYSIKRENFINVLKKNPGDFEHFCQMREQMNLYNNYERLFLICSSCKGEDHRLWDCPLLHLNFSKQRVLSRFNFSKCQERVSFQRKRICKYNSRKKIKINQSEAKGFGSFTSSEFFCPENNSNSIDFNNQVCNSFRELEENFIEKNDKIMEPILQAEENLKQEVTADDNSLKFDKKSIKLHDSESHLKSKSENHIKSENRCNEECFHEILKEYDLYFPNNNVRLVIEFINKKILDNIKKKNLLKKRNGSLWTLKSPIKSLKEDISSNLITVRKREEKKPSWFKNKMKKLTSPKSKKEVPGKKI